MGLFVSDPQGFVGDARVQRGLQQGIASLASVLPNSVDLSLTVIENGGRRLQDESNVRADYTITISKESMEVVHNTATSLESLNTSWVSSVLTAAVGPNTYSVEVKTVSQAKVFTKGSTATTARAATTTATTTKSTITKSTTTITTTTTAANATVAAINAHTNGEEEKGVPVPLIVLFILTSFGTCFCVYIALVFRKWKNSRAREKVNSYADGILPSPPRKNSYVDGILPSTVTPSDSHNTAEPDLQVVTQKDSGILLD